MSMFNFWLVFGFGLVLAEFFLPGLVAVFVGMGALTVAFLMYFELIDGIALQFIAFFIASLIYTFTLRILIIRFYPSDTKIQSVDEDLDLLGKKARVTETIAEKTSGRISHADTTWNARAKDGGEIPAGEDVRITGRDNITLIVEKVK